MIVCIGSRSDAKTSAVSRAFSKFPELWLKDEKIEFLTLPKDNRGDAKNSEIDKVSGVSCNPIGLDEIFLGAKNRAKTAYEFAKDTYGKCDYAVGTEGGLFEVKMVNTGYLEASCVAVFDGENYFYGTSPAFELPKEAVRRTLLGEEAGFMDDVFGRSTKGREGIIGTLTSGRLNRDDFEEAGVICALAQIVRKDIYQK